MKGYTFGSDGRLLLATRFLRLFAYGFLSVVLVLYLAELGLSNARIGLLLTLTLVGDTAISLLITTTADRAGRKRMLLLGCLLMAAAGAIFALSQSFMVLLAAATIGVISPSGKEVGPFLAIEQASLAHIVPSERQTQVFGIYNLVGSLATAFGSLAGGGMAQLLLGAGYSRLSSYRAVLFVYAAFGLLLAAASAGLSRRVETTAAPAGNRRLFLGLHTSGGIVARLSALFSIDAFAGGLITQSIIAYWFQLRFGTSPAILGSIFFGANLLAAASALVAARLASRFGLINTMVFTHIPSNILLILVPFMPTLPLAVLLLLLRSSISQMDVPTRQAYTMAVVEPDERSAAAGITGVARTAGSAISPTVSLPLISVLMGGPFLAAGVLKIIYDAALWLSFRSTRKLGAGPR